MIVVLPLLLNGTRFSSAGVVISQSHQPIKIKLLFEKRGMTTTSLFNGTKELFLLFN
jgi:hypothetical protein